MSKRKNITVTITVAKDGSATFSIDKPGPADRQTKAHKYCRMQAAWRGALRQLDAFDATRGNIIGGIWQADIGPKWGIRNIKRIIIRK